MADVESLDPLVSTEEVEVDAIIDAVIEAGIRSAEEGRCLTSAEVRKLIPEWISRYSTQNSR